MTFDYKKMDEGAIHFEAEQIAERKAREKRGKYEAHFGTFGKYILEVGTGGGFTAIPHAMDMYEGALGLSRDETWLIKRLCKYLPNIYPSMARIAMEANTSEPTLSRIKSRLIKKGFIRDNGKHSNDALQRDLDITPFFDSLFLCILCDPKSKIVKGQTMDKARTEFTENSYSISSDWYKRREQFSFTELPLSIEAAKKFAEMRGIVLDWDYIPATQSGAALQELESMKADKKRMLEIKDAVNLGISGAFGIVYKFGKVYEWLKWLCNTSVRSDEVESLTASYVEQAEMPNAKEYMEWMREVIQSPENTKILAEREVYHAIREAAYAE